MSMKNSLTPTGIEPATFRFVAEHLNHCATAVPPIIPKHIGVILFCMLYVNLLRSAKENSLIQMQGESSSKMLINKLVLMEGKSSSLQFR